MKWKAKDYLVTFMSGEKAQMESIFLEPISTMLYLTQILHSGLLNLSPQERDRNNCRIIRSNHNSPDQIQPAASTTR